MTAFFRDHARNVAVIFTLCAALGLIGCATHDGVGIPNPVGPDVTIVHYSPRIGSVSPQSGRVGDTITIVGSYLGGQQATVKFNGVVAKVVLGDGDSILVTVPAGARTGRVTVTTEGGTATSANDFVVK